MATRISYAITDNNVTVNFDGQTHIIARTDELANKLIGALREGKVDTIPGLVSAAKRIEKYGKGKFTVKDGTVYVNGSAVHDVLSRKILKFEAEGLPYEPLVKFAEKVQRNPSYRAVTELFTFLEKNDHPLTEDGNFIAYKRVRSTFKDIHSNTYDNSVGTVVEMPRNQVNEDPTQTCSYGLHVANWEYAHTQFASSDPSTDIMLQVEVDPADVVAIPVDYNNAKMRVCRYKVLCVVNEELSSKIQLHVTEPATVVDPSCSDCPCPCCCCDDCEDEELDEEEEEEEEEETYCVECGMQSYGYDLCDECEYGEDYDEDEDEDVY